MESVLRAKHRNITSYPSSCKQGMTIQPMDAPTTRYKADWYVTGSNTRQSMYIHTLTKINVE